MNPARNLYQTILIAVVAFAFGCSVMKSDDREKDVRAFLTTFQTAMAKPAPALINAFFQTTQHKQNIIDALTVLQNKDSSGVKCKAEFGLATITFYEKRMEVHIPVSFKENDIDEESHIDTETLLTFWIERVKNDLKITEVEGAEFYQVYTAVKNYKQWSEIYKKELASREQLYATAAMLEQKFDSVIWYVNNGKQTYYYAVSGAWKNYFMEKGDVPATEYKMGLINEKGDTLIPFEYEFIGTIGFVKPSIVEVKRDGKYGFFDLDSGKLVLEPKYDMIIPYQHESSDATYLVLQDTTYGWLSPAYQYHVGYPSQHAIDYAFNYGYLQNRIVLKVGNQVFCEIPSKDHIGYGIIIPPSYYVKNKIFDQVVGGINTTSVPMNGWTDYIESAKSMVARIGEGIHAIISVLSERYIGGREEFYGSSQVTFMNENEEVMAETEMPTDQEVVFTHLGDGLVELKATGAGWHYWTPGGERDIPVYKYFQIIDETTLEEKESKRIFNFTEFVKLDSSYITGTFAVVDYVEPAYDPESEPEVVEETRTENKQQEESSESVEVADEPVEEEYYGEEYAEENYRDIDMLTVATLKLIRDEIAAVNGVRPDNAENASRFENQGYAMPYTSRDQIHDPLSEIDAHNLNFLDKVINDFESGVNQSSGI